MNEVMPDHLEDRLVAPGTEESNVDRTTAPQSAYTRLSVNINASTASKLRALAADQGVTVTEIIRRAVGTYDVLQHEAADNAIVLEGKNDNSRRELVFL